VVEIDGISATNNFEGTSQKLNFKFMEISY